MKERGVGAASWDERYAADAFYYGCDPNDFLIEQAGAIHAGSRVLCLAEGEGRNAVFLARQGWQVTAVDQSTVGLRKASALAQRAGVTIHTVVSDLADYVIEPGAWQGIVSIWCHVPQPLRAELHRRVVAGLAPGGVFLLEAYTPDQLRYGTGGPPTADLLPTLSALREELVGLEFTVGRELLREVHEGQGHHGLSAVVQVLARKPSHHQS